MLWLSVSTGVLATAISTSLALIVPGVLFGSKKFHWLHRYMAPILSLPHITVAVGMAFLLQPSGWFIRLISPWWSGWDRPPNLALLPDEHGLMLVLGLVAKEVPFLVLMMLSSMGQIDVLRMLITARSLGYSKMKAWLVIIIPQLWQRMRLAVMIVLVFSLSVVDMAEVLAPSLPPPLAVRNLEWYQDPDFDLRFIASAAAVLQLLIALVAMGSVFAAEKILSFAYRNWVINGKRGIISPVLSLVLRGGVLTLGAIPIVLAFAGMASALLWSVAGAWRFPDAFPVSLTLRYWQQLGGQLGTITLNTLLLGIASAFISLVFAIFWLERKKSRLFYSEQVIFFPLLVPQIGFLFGLQVVLLWLGLDGSVLAILWVHCLYVFPYIWLALAPSWRNLDSVWEEVAASLGQKKLKRLFRVKVPMLLTPLLTSFAIGFSVSASLYLPTAFAGNAQFQTLTLEAVGLASAAGRQSLGVATGMQMILPLVIFIGVGMISRFRFRNFSGIG